MSATVPATPAAKAITDDAISKSETTNQLVSKAMVDPVVMDTLLNQLLSVVGDRSLLGTQTFWVTLLTPVLTYGAGYLAKYLGAPLDPVTIGIVATALGTLAAWTMKRYFNSTVPVTSVLPKTT